MTTKVALVSWHSCTTHQGNDIMVVISILCTGSETGTSGERERREGEGEGGGKSGRGQSDRLCVYINH